MTFHAEHQVTATPAGLGQPVAGLVAVVGAKGGCGATFTAVHLARGLSAHMHVGLLDLDFSKGDVGGYLNPWPKGDIGAALGALPTLDPSMLQGLVTERGPGLSVLPQPFDLAQLEVPTMAELTALLKVASATWPMVVADCGSRLDPCAVGTIRQATRVVIVAQATIPALRDARRLLSVLTWLGIPLNRMGLVANQTSPKDLLTAHHLAEELGVQLLATLPMVERIPIEVELPGHLAQDALPGTDLVTQLDDLSLLLAGLPPRAVKASLLSRIFSRLPWRRS